MICKHNTGKDFEGSDYESWGSVDEENLTNTGVLRADESPIRHSRVFCTSWNGLDNASGSDADKAAKSRPVSQDGILSDGQLTNEILIEFMKDFQKRK